MYRFQLEFLCEGPLFFWHDALPLDALFQVYTLRESPSSPLEAMVFIAEALNLFGLLGHFDRELFHQIHQRDEHLAQTFIFNRCRIEIFYHIPTVPVPLGFV